MGRSPRHLWALVAAAAIAALSLAGARDACAASFISTGDGGWEWVKPTPSGQSWESAFFLNDRTGWLVGSDCCILKTTDGGRNWAPQGQRSRKLLSDVWFSDKDHGCAVGQGFGNLDPSGIIFKTTDGGATWRKVLDGGIDGLRAESFVNSSTGWAVGGYPGPAFMMKTADGGETWSKQDCGVPNPGTFDDVSFVDENNGRAVGVGKEIYRTTDGGKSWTVDRQDVKGRLHAIQFVDGKTGWAVSGQGMIATTDGGKNWTELSVPNVDYIYDFRFSDAQNGVLTGTFGKMLRTKDGGKTWTPPTMPPSYWGLECVRFSDSRNGWAVGRATIYHTSDGGESWSAQSSGSVDLAMGVEFINSKVGWTVGSNNDSKNLAAVILKTEDGGQTWARQTIPVKAQLNKVQFVDDKTGWAAGWYGAIVATKDGGRTWHVQTSGTKSLLLGLHFIDSDTGWAVGKEGTVLGTTDGGDTWSKLDTATMDDLHGVFFVNAKIGWLSGAKGRIVKTTDGGKTWKRQPSGTSSFIGSMYFTDKNTGWACGTKGVVLNTTDGGETWAQQKSGVQDQLVAIRFVSDKEGWAAGGGRTIIHTTDAGRTWVAQDSGSWNGLWDVQFTDQNNGWAVGGRTVLRTTTGGLPGAVWAKKQADGAPANFGHLAVTKKSSGYLLAEHPDSRIGIHIKTSDTKPNVGDYVYVHGKVATENSEKIIAADSIDVQCAGWGILPAKN